MKLINGDCLEEMKKIPDGSIDLILTDPPYGMSFQSSYRKEKHNKIKNDNNLDWLEDFSLQCYNLLKPNCAAYLFCSFHHLDKFKQALENSGFEVKNILTWVKNNTSMGDLKGNFASKTEFVIFACKGRPLIRGKRDSNVLNYARTANELHPTQKPVDLLEFLLNKFSDENHSVLDPFMGSGSTGVACKNTNRDFIGIELDKDYFKIAKKRIEETKPVLHKD
jgi:site-specific DNA-methyltransferase (adenine-specific)